MRKIFTLILLSFIIQYSYSQTKQEAEKLFDKGEYLEALRTYKLLYEKDTANFDVNYNIGKCYLNMNTDRSLAVKYLEWAAKRPKRVGNEVFFHLAVAHFHSHHFPLAILTFKKYLTVSIKKLEFENEARHYIEMCENAQNLLETPINIEFIHIGKEINSPKCEDNPFVSEDEQTLVYSSNRRDNLHEVYATTKSRFFDSWSKGKPLSNKLKTLYEAKTGGLSADGKTLFIYYSESSPAKDIDISKRKRSKFSGLLNIGKPINSDYSEQGGNISKSGDTLFFASDMPGGFGGYDIYMCIKLPNKKWGLPINLGATINTKYDDNFPVYTDSLIFSSKGHNSMGGYDLFSTKYNYETSFWNTPANLGYPLNNTYDNKSLSMFDKRYGYISAYRKDSEGDLDIYKVVFNEVNFEHIIYRGTIFAGDSLDATLVKDFDPDVTINVYHDKTGEIYGTYSYKQLDCSYVISLAPGGYILEIEGPSYIVYRKKINIPHSTPSEEESIVLNNIYLKKKNNASSLE